MLPESWALVGHCASVRFCVVADADPGVLNRLLQPFARRDLLPDSVDGRRSGDTVTVEIAMAAMPAEAVHLVEGNLAQVVGVRSVSRRQEITGMVQRRAA
jgi:hypothetical protein